MGWIASLLAMALKFGGSALAWMKTLKPMSLACLALTAIALYQHFHLARVEHHDAATSRALATEKRAHAADIARYRAAQDAAKVLNERQIAAILGQQKAITERIVHEKDANIIELRRLADSGRLQPGIIADRGNSGSAPTGNPGASATGAASQTGLCLSPKELLSAAENEERHDRLIDWAIGQGKVNTNP